MTGEIVQISFRLPREVVDSLNQSARESGFNRNAFLTHLLLTWRDYRRLDTDEQDMLLHLTRWGQMNFRNGRPDIQTFAHTARMTQKGVRDLIQRFLNRGWMVKRTHTASGVFDADITMGDDVYGLTAQGLMIAGFCR